MDYVIKNHKNLYIRLNKNGKPVTCTEYEKTLFEYSKAKNILDNLPKTLHRLNFRVEVVPDIVQDTHKMTQCNPSVIENKIIQAEEYIISEQIKRWIEKFGICDDIIKEAKKKER